jgi:hypothetical protein
MILAKHYTKCHACSTSSKTPMGAKRQDCCSSSINEETRWEVKWFAMSHHQEMLKWGWNSFTMLLGRKGEGWRLGGLIAEQAGNSRMRGLGQSATLVTWSLGHTPLYNQFSFASSRGQPQHRGPMLGGVRQAKVWWITSWRIGSSHLKTIGGTGERTGERDARSQPFHPLSGHGTRTSFRSTRRWDYT